MTEDKKITLKDKINKLVDEITEKDELKKAIFSLIQRIQFPDQFCPDCDDRLFLNGQTQECLNCGFSRESTARPIVKTGQSTTSAQPTAIRQSGKTPDVVEKVIQQAADNMRDVPRNVSPSAKGAQIRKLAESLGDSTVPVTPQDTEIVKNADPNVRDVNWVK